MRHSLFLQLSVPHPQECPLINISLEPYVLSPQNKTFIGRVAKGVEFLGYSFEPKGLSIAPKTLAKLLDRITPL
jgi:hypothetical protein